jgi:peptide/nickel transport system permease protein
MSTFLARRGIYGVFSIWAATMLVFLLLRVLPGDLALYFLVGREGSGTGLRPEDVERVRQIMGLDVPLYMQYLNWMWGIIRLDFGESVWLNAAVAPEMFHRFPVTLQLAVGGTLLGTIFGLPLGVISAVKQDTWGDYISRVTAIFFLAFPTFWLALMALLIGVHLFEWMPPIGYNVFWQNPMDTLKQMAIPSLILASHQMAIVSRLTRSSMLEVLREDYVRTARAKGLGEQTILIRHALRNALIPVITVIALSFGGLLGGTVVLESIFSLPGVGSLTLEAIHSRDLPVTQAAVFLLAGIFVVINLLVDVSYGWIDPRIRVT